MNRQYIVGYCYREYFITSIDTNINIVHSLLDEDDDCIYYIVDSEAYRYNSKGDETVSTSFGISTGNLDDILKFYNIQYKKLYIDGRTYENLISVINEYKSILRDRKLELLIQ